MSKLGIEEIINYFIDDQQINNDFNIYITNKDLIKKYNIPDDKNKITFNTILNNINIYPYINVIPYINDNVVDKLIVFDKYKKVQTIDNITIYNIVNNRDNEVYTIKCNNDLYNSYFVNNFKLKDDLTSKINVGKIEINCNLSNNEIENSLEKDINKLISNYDILGITKNIYLNEYKKTDYESIDKKVKVSVKNVKKDNTK